MTDAVWNQVAQRHGYDSIRDLLREWLPVRSRRDVAKLLGCDPQTVTRLAEVHGVDVAPVRVKKSEPEIPEQVLRECSVRELAARYEISKSRAARLKLRRGGYAAVQQGEEE